MNTEEAHVEKSSVRRLFLPALVLANVSAFLILPLFNLNLLDIAKTFHVTVGTAGQAIAIGRIVGLVVGLALGVLSVRFKHKPIYFLGIALVALGYAGLYLAKDFAIFVFFNCIQGAGIPMIVIMSVTIVGDFLVKEKRGRAVGFLTSALYLALFFGYPITGYIAGAVGWKSIIVLWMIPFVLSSFVLSFFALRSNAIQQPSAVKSYAGAFKQVFSNKSAVACILAAMCAFISAQINVYTPTFLRINFNVPLVILGVIAFFGSGLTACGAIIGGYLAKPFHRRTLISVASFLAGLSTMSFLFMPTLMLNLSVGLPAGLVEGMAGAALLALALEQVPGAKGTMMSLNNSLGVVLGAVLGTVIGGSVLNLTGNNYQILGVTLGAFAIAEAAIVLFLTREPS
jgi:predicted MFS family arabinose efflux permease